jgi:hypothetical protein
MDRRSGTWHYIHIRHKEERERTHAIRLAKRRAGIASVNKKVKKREMLHVPAIMCLINNYEITANFIKKIKHKVIEEEHFILLDFRTCQMIGTETCVVLAAEIDRCLKCVPDSITGSYPTNPQVYFFLNEIGFFQLLGIQASKPVFDNYPDMKAVRLESGRDNPENLLRGIKGLFYDDSQDAEESGYPRNVYRALTEAMGNAVEHAYPKHFLLANEKSCIPEWWRAGFKSIKENFVLIILYDQGAGIPNTLETNWAEQLQSLITRLSRTPSDSEKIELAMERGRSRTRYPGRGQGSYDMQSVIRESKNGELRVLSYRGNYRYQNTGTWTSVDMTTPLEGTLVIWRLELTQNAEDK